MGNVVETRRGPLNDRNKEIAEIYLDAVLGGDKGAQLRIKHEVLTTADFADTFAKVNNIAVADQLTEVPIQWDKVAKRAVVQNFNPTKEVRLDFDNDLNVPSESGGYERIPGTLSRVPEGTEFPTVGFGMSGKAFSTSKSGIRVHFSFEAVINDDWGQLAALPGELARMARYTEETDVFRQYFAGPGFNSGIFGTGSNIAGNPVLNYTTLSAAITQASKPPATGTNGIPLVNTITGWSLLVPVGLALYAESLLATTELIVTDPDGTERKTPNTLRGKVTVVEVPWFPILAPASAYAETFWALVPQGGVSPYGTIVNLAFLAGHEQPDLRIKYDQGLSLSGGTLGAYDGSFDNDTTQIRLRHFVQGNTLNNTFGVAWSKGTAVAGNTP